MSSSSNVFRQLINEEKLNNIVNFSTSDYDRDLIHIIFNLPHDTLSKCTGISICFKQINGRSFFETLLIGHFVNSIFDADFIYDSDSGYDDTKGFIEINDLVDEIIRVHNFYLNQ